MPGSRNQKPEIPPWEARLQAQVDEFNEVYPIGTAVRAWRGVRGGGGGIDTKTRSAAYVLSGHTPVVCVDGVAGCIALTHILPLVGRVCRQCGCTDDRACVVDGVACHWVEPNLCSACAPAPEAA